MNRNNNSVRDRLKNRVAERNKGKEQSKGLQSGTFTFSFY